MLRPSGYLEKLEDKLVELCGPWIDRHKAKFPVYIPLGLVGWYFYGMFLNSLRLGTAATFHSDGEEIKSIWVFNPLRNWFVLLTPFGLGVTAVIVLLICLITKKGYIWFSGYKYTHDPRGFDILPDATHGSSGFLSEREMREFLELGTADNTRGMMLGKHKKRESDADKYALYAAHHMIPGDNNNLLCIGAPGSGKSRGFIIPFLMGCAKRGESVFITDPKGELFEKLSPYFKEHGHYVKAVNFLDMAHSDGWNCLHGLDTETQLVQTVANTIIRNTSGPGEADDFWARAELNLLMALLHYVCNLKDANGKLLPIEQRSIGDVYQLIANKSINEINQTLAALPADHPAKGHHGLFLKARENLWGNIVIGLGNRLAIFQNKLVDAIIRNHDVDLLLPGQKPCAYFVIISAQDSAYRFLSSLFFSLALPRLSDYARLEGKGGRLPVLVNFCLDEYCNIGYMEGMADALNSIRGFTAVGSFGGSLKNTSAAELGAIVVKEALKRANVAPEHVDEVMFGGVLTAGLGQNVARQVSIKAGIPYSVPAYTVNMVCGSGMKTVIEAARTILAGDADIIVTGGTESMSQAPFAAPDARWGARMGDKKLVDTMIKDGLWDAYNNYHMGTTAENINDVWGITRREQDEFAASSQQKAEAAIKSGRFEDEIVPVPVKVKKETVEFKVDEYPKPGVTADGIAKLRGAFPVGPESPSPDVVHTFEPTGIKDAADKGQQRVTAANASGLNDGAAAIIVASGEAVKKYGLKPMAKLIGWGQGGVDPKIMGVGPVPASRQAMKKAGVTIDDIDLIEANEAFAAQSVAVGRELGFDLSKVNVNGGAIAIGHPIGCSGARIIVTLLHELQKRPEAKKGLATLCIGGGMGVTTIFEKC